MMKRTPPNSNTASPYSSDSNMKAPSEAKKQSALRLNKRKRSDDREELLLEMNKMFSKFEEKQNTQIMTLTSVVQEVKGQNDEIKKSIQFLTEKYDEVLLTTKKIQENCNNNKERIRLLENKIEILERNLNAASVEFRNIPKLPNESKENLCNTVEKLGSVVMLPIEKGSIKNIFRLKPSITGSGAGSIIAEFNSADTKEALIKATKLYRKSNQLTTSDLQLSGPRAVIYTSELLTSNAKRLFFKARQLAKEHNFKFCWTAYGKVYLRKADGHQRHLVSSDEDLAKLFTET